MTRIPSSRVVVVTVVVAVMLVIVMVRGRSRKKLGVGKVMESQGGKVEKKRQNVIREGGREDG